MIKIINSRHMVLFTIYRMPQQSPYATSTSLRYMDKDIVGRIAFDKPFKSDKTSRPICFLH